MNKSIHMLVAFMALFFSQSAYAQNVPLQPDNVSLTARGITPIAVAYTLKWSAPSHDGGADITGYETQVNGDAWEAVSGSSSYTFIGGPNTPYTVGVRAKNSAGAGHPAYAYILYTPSDTGDTPSGNILTRSTPGAVSNLTVTEEENTVTFSWEYPSNDGGAEVEGYQFKYTPGHDYWSDTTETSVTIEDLYGDKPSYDFRVRAVNSEGVGYESSITGTPIGMLTGPTVVQVESTGYGTAKVTWTAPSKTNGHPILGYRVGIDEGTESVGPSVTSATLTGFQPSNKYYIYVAVIYDHPDEGEIEIPGDPWGWYVHDHSVENEYTGPVPLPPDPVTDTPENELVVPLAVENLSSQGKVVSWDPPRHDDGFPITRYEYRYDVASAEEASDWQTVPGGADVRSIDFSDSTLERETYYVEVRAVNEAGAGDAIGTYLDGRVPPGQVANLKINSPYISHGGPYAGTGTVTLTWDPPTDDGGSKVTHYRYFGGGKNGETRETYVVIKGLGLPDSTSSGRHEFQVAAVNKPGEGALSDTIVVDFNNLPHARPGAVQGLSVEPRDGGAFLYWSDPSDRGTGIAGYSYRYKADDDTTWSSWTHVYPSIRSAEIGELTNGTEYTFSVLAFNKNPNGGARAEGPEVSVKVTPHTGTAPGNPTNINVSIEERDGIRYVKIVWDPPRNNGGFPILGYYWRIEQRVSIEGHAKEGEDVWGPWLTVGTNQATFEASKGAYYHSVNVKAYNLKGEGGSSIYTPLNHFSPYDQDVGTVSESPAQGAAPGASGSAFAQSTPAVPGKVDSLEITHGNQQATLTWTPPADDGGSAITGYEVHYFDWRLSTYSDTVAVAGGVDARSHTISGLVNGQSYTFMVRAVNAVGDGPWSDSTVITVLNPGAGLTLEAFPNPFNPSTTISFALPVEGFVDVAIYNVLGQRVRTLVANQEFSQGSHNIRWDSRNDQGKRVASGVYIYRLQALGHTISRKLILLR